MADQTGTRESVGSIECRLAYIIDGLGTLCHKGGTVIPGQVLSELLVQHPEQARATTLQDLGFDSLDTLDAVMAIEDWYQIVIPDKDYDREGFNTKPLSDIASYVHRRLAESR